MGQGSFFESQVSGPVGAWNAHFGLSLSEFFMLALMKN